MQEQGFTLVELVIVIAIIAILASVLIPVFNDVKEDKTQQIIDIYNGQQKVFVDENGNELEDVTGMQLYEIENKDGKIYMYFRKGE